MSITMLEGGYVSNEVPRWIADSFIQLRNRSDSDADRKQLYGSSRRFGSSMYLHRSRFLRALCMGKRGCFWVSGLLDNLHTYFF